jgi:ABC-type transporter Mla subunit MlaD
VDADAAKAALTAARESLSQMTQLPAAQQLAGENRTQVTQLIANFNELITTNSEWKASYAKVEANLNALIGGEASSDEPKAAPTAAAPGTAGTAGTAAPGAVGTSGTAAASIDPAVKAKLAEFRTHLKEFEKAAGGAKDK